MAQFSTRIAVRVDSISSWEKLQSMDLSSYGLSIQAKELFSSKKKQIVLGDEWSCSEEMLEKLVKEIVKKNKRSIVIADTTDYNVDPFTFGVTYFGQKVETFLAEEPDAGYDLSSEVDISDISAWIAAAPCAITTKTQKYLKEFGIKSAVKKTSTPIRYLARFYFSGDDLRGKMASMMFLGTDRGLLPELEDPQKKYLLSSVSDKDVSFEVPAMVDKEIDQCLKEFAEKFDKAYVLAWKELSDRFIFKYVLDGEIHKKDIPLAELDLDVMSIIDSGGLGDVVDMRTLSAYIER